MKAATSGSKCWFGQGINAVSEIEETAHITPVFGVEESSLGARNPLAIVRFVLSGKKGGSRQGSKQDHLKLAVRDCTVSPHRTIAAVVPRWST